MADERERGSGAARLAIAAAAGATALATALATARGAGLTPDSVAYVVWADRIESSPGAVLDPGRHVAVGTLGKWPPLYSTVLALLRPLTGDPLLRGRLLGILLAAVVVVLAALLVRRAASWAAAAGAAVVLAVSHRLVTDVFGLLQSESLWLALTLGGLLLLSRALDAASARSAHLQLALGALALGAAGLTRLIGVSVLVGVGLAGLRLCRGTQLGRRSWTAALALAAAPAAAYLLATNSARASTLALQPDPVDRVRTGLLTVTSWVLPGRLVTAGPAEGPSVAVGLALAGAVAVVAWRRGWPARIWAAEGRAARLALLLVVPAAAYGAFLVWTALLVDRNVQLVDRFLVPLWIVAVVLGAVAVDRAPAVPRAAAAVALGWVLVMGAETAGDVRDLARLGEGYTEVAWQDSETLALAEAQPDDVVIVSDAPDGVAVSLGRPVGRLPELQRADHDARLRDVAAEVRAGRAALLLFDIIDRPYYADAQRVEAVTGLRLRRTADGWAALPGAP